MGNTTLLRGHCVAPFLDASLFPQDGGFVEGRFCAPIPYLPGSPTCCLPCPAADWAYSDNFQTYGTVAEWLNVVGLILMVFMLVSYLVLPAQQTRSHYLSVCLIVSVSMISIGFTIPLAAQPDQCYNEITPNDMHSLTECAWSGAFLMAGGLTAATWVFIRALSMNLQICWDIVPARKFFYISQALGWGIPAALFTATITATGVSFRFGNACHVNHENSIKDFWGPLMAIAAGAGILQLMTFAHCIKIYLKNLWTDEAPTSTNASESGGLPSYSGSVRTQTARAVYRRLKKVLWLQWRGICIVTIILVDVIFFSIVFVYLDNLQSSVQSSLHKVQPWLNCLAVHPEDKNKCLSLVSDWLVSEAMVVSVLLLLSLTGVQVFIFLTRPTIFSAWGEFLRNKFSRRNEFVSLDAKSSNIMRTNSKQGLLRYTGGNQNTTFEMQRPNPQGLGLDTGNKTLSPTQTMLSSPDEAYKSPLHGYQDSPADYASPYFSTNHAPRIPSPNLPASPLAPTLNYNPTTHFRQGNDYFTSPRLYTRPIELPGSQVNYERDESYHRSPPSRPRTDSQERLYNAPRSSFSAPKAPSRQSSVRSVTFDSRDVYIRGGLGLNPPSEVGESREDLVEIQRGQSMDRF